MSAAAMIHTIRWHAHYYLWLMPLAFVRGGLVAAAKARHDQECFREYVEQWEL